MMIHVFKSYFRIRHTKLHRFAHFPRKIRHTRRFVKESLFTPDLPMHLL